VAQDFMGEMAFPVIEPTLSAVKALKEKKHQSSSQK